MIRPPPRSPLFPCTPLFRSGRQADEAVPRRAAAARQYPSRPLQERLRMTDPQSDSADVLVIGAGAAGAALVWSLSRRGLDVDRKSTRLNSSHANTSYAVLCL